MQRKIQSSQTFLSFFTGNMWAQSWVSLLDITQPFPGKPSVDVTPIMQAKVIKDSFYFLWLVSFLSLSVEKADINILMKNKIMKHPHVCLTLLE